MNIEEIQKQIIIKRLTAMWALSEAALGGLLHALKVPFTGLFVGGVSVIFISLIGYFSDRVKKRKQFIVLSIFLTICCLMPVIYFPKMPLMIVYTLLFGIGFFSAGELLNFTLATELNSKEVKGSAIAFTNCIVSFGSGLIQPVIGMLLDLNWSGRKENGINIYASADYQFAFVIFPLFLILALFMTFFLKEGKIKESAVEIKSSD